MSTAQSTLTCLCGAVSEPGSLLDATNFPIPAGVCNCDTCRHSIGTMGCSSVKLKSAPSDKSLAACSTYSTSKYITRYFCKTCGTKVFFYIERDDSTKWCALPGIIERQDSDKAGTISVKQTWFVSDTEDGGLAKRIADRMIAGAPGSPRKEDFDFYAGSPRDGSKTSLDQVKQLWTEPKQSTGPPDHAMTDTAAGSCHCGAVQFKIARPDPTKHDLKSQKLQTYLRQNDTKYMAKLCTCRSCRLGLGLPLHPWTWIMPENILTKSGEQVDFDFKDGLKNLPGLNIFRSSKDVRRSFCRTCGASVFFEKITRPEVIDICMGLFNSPTGAMAADFFEWNWDVVGYREECRDEEYLQMLVGPQK